VTAEATDPPDWLAIARYKYYNEPEFHAFVNVVVNEIVAGREGRRHDPAIVRAGLALVELRDAMQDVRITSPSYMPGHEPTAADNCSAILDMLDHGIRNIAAYLEIRL
jgi:hypothetical protein